LVNEYQKQLEEEEERKAREEEERERLENGEDPDEGHGGYNPYGNDVSAYMMNGYGGGYENSYLV
jgi:hypothetical protein